MMGVIGKNVINAKVMKDLVEGYEDATKLQAIIKDGGSGGGFANELVAKILNSFDETISALSNSCSESASEGYSSGLNQLEDSTVPELEDLDCRLEDSGESRKRAGSYCKNKRGSYKRTKNSHAWSVVSATFEDSHAWRKYGQKEILNAKFPRSYFRCTHKGTQGCKALKQVQKLPDESENYQITYIGAHSCTSEPTKIESSDMNISSITTSSNKFIFRTPMVIKPEETASQHGGGQDVVVDAEDLSLVWNDILRSEDSGTSPKFSCNEANSYGVDIGYGGLFGFEENSTFL